ncbi:MAG: hypothetical protein R3C11_29835 [Planctomycetaceae bacterium]
MFLSIYHQSGSLPIVTFKLSGDKVDGDFQNCYQFNTSETLEVKPDLLVPAVGYHSRLSELTNGKIELSQFHLGCVHVEFPDLFLVGFARPIIGNIPSISEIQARYVCGLIAQKYERPQNIQMLHQELSKERSVRYHKINQNVIYPVEMFPYCDHLARLMQTYPDWKRAGSIRSWWRKQLAPATTMHYLTAGETEADVSRTAPTYLPSLLIGFILFMKPISWLYSLS